MARIVLFSFFISLISQSVCLPAPHPTQEPPHDTISGATSIWYHPIPVTAPWSHLTSLGPLPVPPAPTFLTLPSSSSVPDVKDTQTGPAISTSSKTSTPTEGAGPTKTPHTSTITPAPNSQESGPFAVVSTTISHSPFILTYVPMKATAATDIVEDGPKPTTTHIFAGGSFWSIPKLPLGFPAIFPPPPPPLGLPDPLSIGGRLGCIFGCGHSNNGNGGGGGGEDGQDNDNQSDDKGSSTRNSETTTKASSSISKSSSSQSKSTSSTSTTSCSSRAIPMCTQKIVLSTSISGSTTKVQTQTTTQCSTVTACSGEATTATTTTATATTREPCSPSCSACMNDDDEAPTSTPPNPLKIAARAVAGPGDHPFNGNIASFMIDLTDSNAPKTTRVAGRQVPVPGSPGTPSSAVVKEFLDDDFNLSMRGFKGCTSVAVISRAGVYMSHLWEKPSFEIPENFRPHVLDPLDGGDGTARMPGIRPLTEPRPLPLPQDGDQPGLLAAINQPQVLIITPLYVPDEKTPNAPNPNPNALNLLFPTQVGQIQARLREIPGYENVRDVPIQEIPYTPAKTLTRGSALGMVLFQYDPNQRRCGGTQRAIARIWAQDGDAPIFTTEWDALATQQVPASANQRRDDACPLSETPTTTTAGSSSATKQPTPTVETSAPASPVSTNKPNSTTKAPPALPLPSSSASPPPPPPPPPPASPPAKKSCKVWEDCPKCEKGEQSCSGMPGVCGCTG